MDQPVPAYQLRIADTIIIGGHAYRIGTTRLEHRDGAATVRLAYVGTDRHDQVPAAAPITRIRH